MPRRAKTSLQPLHFAGIAVLIALVAGGGWYLLGHRNTESGLGGGTDLSVREFLQNSNALSGNNYKLEGTVRDRLDQNWRASDGRLLSVEVSEGAETALLPVLVPAKLVNKLNIERDQRYRFRVTVQAETGILEAVAISKS